MAESEDKIFLTNSLFGKQKPQITLSPVRLQKIKVGKASINDEIFDSDKNSYNYGGVSWSVSKEQTVEPVRPVHYSHTHSKKVIKHALLQQAKRRKKNTKIAAGTSPLVPPHFSQTSQSTAGEESDYRIRVPTVIELLLAIPGLNMKRKRSNKKLSTAAQLEQTKEGCIDLETPDSILVQTNLRDLLNEQAFSSLPQLYQQKLIQLLPSVDRILVNAPAESIYKLSHSGLNNEFFKSACSEWRDRLSDGEFTPENQQKRKLEAERERNKLDPWKIKHFEPIWGDNANVLPNIASSCTKEFHSPKSSTTKMTTIKRPPSPLLRNRTVGAVTRSVSMYHEKREAEELGQDRTKKIKLGTTLSNNYLTTKPALTSTVTKAQTHEKRPRLDNPLEVEAVNDSTETESSHAEPLLKTVKLEANVETQLPEETVSAEDSAEVLAIADENVASISKFMPAVTSPHTIVVGKPSYASPVTDVNSDQFISATFSTDSNRTITQPTEVNNVIHKQKFDGDTHKHIDEGKIRSPESQNESEIVKVDYTVETESRKSDIAPVKMEIIEPDMTQLKEEITAGIQQDGDRSVREEIIQELNVQKQIEPIIPKSCRENVDGIENEMEVDAENNVVYDVNISNVDKYENSNRNTSEKVNSYTTVVEEELLESINIEKMIKEEEAAQRENYEDDQIETNILSAWDAVDSDGEKLLAEMNLSNIEETLVEEPELEEDVKANEKVEAEINTSEFQKEIDEISVENKSIIFGKVCLTEQETVENAENSSSSNPSEQLNDGCFADGDENVEQNHENPPSGNVEKAEPVTVTSNDEELFLEDSISFEKMISDGEESWGERRDEQVQAAILAAAISVVGSSTDKLLTEAVLEREAEVSVIPMREELEIRLEESCFPVPEWVDFDGKSGSSLSVNRETNISKTVPYPSGHVKLELEVTLIPEVDNRVTSSGDADSCTSSKSLAVKNAPIAPSTVIPPTTIVCLPTTNSTVPPPPPSTQLVTSQAVSSSALPYIALTTSTPVRAVLTKNGVKSNGRVSRNQSNKAPPGVVNLERSYQICQAVIQNSPNRNQLKFQLKPPAPLKGRGKEYSKAQSLSCSGQAKSSAKSYSVSPAQNSMLIKHVFTSSQGIPVTMAVLPPSNAELTKSQMGQYLLMQRSDLSSGIRRSNSAPPTNQKSGTHDTSGQERPASVGIQQLQQPSESQTIYAASQQYGLVTRVNSGCSCSRKAMVICKKCGAFCHDDCIEPYKMCVNCRHCGVVENSEDAYAVG
ncbi:hypothetical protein V9T40_001833 [Parthenolecanium corni]|uniref:DEUBAD domain-containing protein n=1 Tax=Parthenolecanium corni TaxID=536013 RepID=A0AAN9Y4S0_9HEMI